MGKLTVAEADKLVASGVITGITTSTTADQHGSNYKSGDIIKIVNMISSANTDYEYFRCVR